VRRLLVLLVALLLLGVTAACGGDSGKADEDVDLGQKIKGLDVSGAFGAEPEVSVDPAVKVDKPQTQVLTKGDGQPVAENKKAMFNILLARGSDGQKLYSSADQGAPTEVTMAENQFFPLVIDSLVGKPQGSRVAIAANVEDVWGPGGAPQLQLKKKDTVLFVLDVLSVEPSDVLDAPKGEEQAPPKGAPTLVEDGDAITSLDFSDAAKTPSPKLEKITLVEGDGPVVRDPSMVSVDYLGQVYGSTKPFDNSFEKEPVSFPLGKGSSLIPAWNKALIGVPRGSRVMLIVPPGDGYGPNGNPQIKVGPKDTMVFVIDILGVG
jgi:peptidylprolyl isomerase